MKTAYILVIAFLGRASLEKTELNGNAPYGEPTEADVQYVSKDGIHLENLEVNFNGDVGLDIPENPGIVSKRQTSTTDCVDDPNYKIAEKFSCRVAFLLAGLGICANKAIQERCCKSHHDNCINCPDKQVTIKGKTCADFFATYGTTYCANNVVKQNCCGTRRAYCETCYGDTKGLTLGEEKLNCSEYLQKFGKCNHHNIIQHCCSSRARFCPCIGDVVGAIISHNEAPGGHTNCQNVFTLSGVSLDAQCKHPNLWRNCCKTRATFCKSHPDIHIIG